MKDKTPAENADFLRREYRKGGKGFEIDGEQLAVWFDEAGMTLAKGRTALQAYDSVHITWEQAAVRIRELLAAGQYISQAMLDQAIDNEHKELAERLLFFYRDDLRDFREMPEERRSEKGGFPDDVICVKELLADKGENAEYGLILGRLEEDIAALRTAPDAPARFWHDPDRLLEDVQDCGIPPLSFPVDGQIPHQSPSFITEDESNAFLTRGSNIESSKYRIFSYFLNEHTAKEKADFLKNEYNNSGSSHALSGADGSWYDGFHGKLQLKREYDKVEMAWSAVAKRVNSLINEGRYMTRAELGLLPEYEKNILAGEIVNFYYNLPEDIERPYPVTHDFLSSDDRQAIREMLDDPEKVDAILTSMTPIWKNTPPEDRYYNTRQAAYRDLNTYKDGTFTLFPQLSAITPPESAVMMSKPPRKPEPAQQLSLFTDWPPKPLPSVEEQRQVIAESAPEIGEPDPSIRLPITQEEIDTLLRQAVEKPENRARIQSQFAENPRSREAAQLLREVYGDLAYTMPRTDGADGYIGLLGEATGITISKGGHATAPLSEREPAETLAVPWPKVQKRITELVEAGQLWAMEASEQAVSEPQGFDRISPEAEPTPELDFDTAAELILGRIMQDTDYLAALNGAKNRAELRNPCTWALEQSIRGHEQDEPAIYHKYFSDFDWNDSLYQYILRQSWENRPLREAPATEQSAAESAAEPPVDESAAEQSVPVTPDSPEPVFFVDWETAQHDFNLRLYNDRDIIGYNKDGVEYAVGRSGNFTYITSTGAFWGGNTVPGNIYEQIEAYQNGTLTEEQVRENYLKILAAFTAQRENADVVTDAELAGQIQTELDGRGFVVSDELIENGLEEYHSRGGQGDFQDIADFIENEYLTAEEPVQLPTRDITAGNFRITDDHLGEGGAKTKFGYNMAAIRTLKQIEAENRAATPEEQETFSRYVGWGGLPQAFDGENAGWGKEYAELKDLLTPEEYEAARASTLNAHYTSPTVIKAIYDTVGRMGFKTGNILEPACGIGNFFGLLPEGMAGSRLYGVELDSITGRIAEQLYPNANITVSGFEKTSLPDSFFDLAIGNVPFGSYKVVDKRYENNNFLIHDYFFAKTLDQVRPGGIVAFVTSKGTMDKQNPEVRKYIAQRAELLGAVRLPNNAFLKNAGTEVTSDILFFQKRDRLIDIQPDWVHLGQTEDGIPLNSYFAGHPEMVLGTMDYDDRMYGNKKETTCKPLPDASLAEQLKEALSHIHGRLTEADLDDIDGIGDMSIPADPSVRNFSYTVVDDTVYFRENSLMYPVDLPATTLDRIKGMVGLRDCVNALIEYQLYEYGDAEIAGKQAELNTLYNAFTAEYGLISSTANSRAFADDSAYYLLSSLEVINEDGELERKADMFTRRTIKQKTVVTSVDTASEALAVSIAEKARVDLSYMARLTGKDEETLKHELKGVIFLNVGGAATQEQAYVTADEYLSGNVREKLTMARAANEALGDNSLAANVEALEAAQPKDLFASEISVRLGST